MISSGREKAQAPVFNLDIDHFYVPYDSATNKEQQIIEPRQTQSRTPNVTNLT